MKVTKPEIKEDKWIRTMCGRCYGMCAIRVHVVNGVAIKIEGEPDSFHGSGGGICGKGVAGLQVLYDPNRLNVPLKRTNPEKGLHADPKWKSKSTATGNGWPAKCRASTRRSSTATTRGNSATPSKSSVARSNGSATAKRSERRRHESQIPGYRCFAVACSRRRRGIVLYHSGGTVCNRTTRNHETDRHCRPIRS